MSEEQQVEVIKPDPRKWTLIITTPYNDRGLVPMCTVVIPVDQERSQSVQMPLEAGEAIIEAADLMLQFPNPAGLPALVQAVGSLADDPSKEGFELVQDCYKSIMVEADDEEDGEDDGRGSDEDPGRESGDISSD